VRAGSLLNVLRHTAVVHLLEVAVELNVFRAWLGHVSLVTMNRYEEIAARMKEAAMKLCEPRAVSHDRGKAGWRDAAALLTRLASL
jgi:integrase/recombinase XerD